MAIMSKSLVLPPRVAELHKQNASACLRTLPPMYIALIYPPLKENTHDEEHSTSSLSPLQSVLPLSLHYMASDSGLALLLSIEHEPGSGREMGTLNSLLPLTLVNDNPDECLAVGELEEPLDAKSDIGPLLESFTILATIVELSTIELINTRGPSFALYPKSDTSIVGATLALFVRQTSLSLLTPNNSLQAPPTLEEESTTMPNTLVPLLALTL